MGDWHLGFWFYVRYFLALPILLLLALPFWIINPFSKEVASKYYIDNPVIDGIHNWIWGNR